ncbi:MAG: hypothetical protein QOJ64_1818 [Acidobacteriota bacterium]|nr:hypothetical protein [Acidobacteriota bacterium]
MATISLLVFYALANCGVPGIASNATQDASLEGARATLLQLIRLSDKQALQSEQARTVMTGETAELNIPSFGKLADTPDRMEMLERNRAIGRVQLFGENNQVTDVYFYLRYDAVWKVSEVRLLSLTGIIEDAYLALSAKPSLTDDEKNDLANMKLVLATDKALTAWFTANLKSFERVYRQVKSYGLKMPNFIRTDDKQFPEVGTALKALHLSGLSVTSNGNLEFVIGGVTDNLVGLIYSPSDSPPAMSPSSYIWVEKVASKWYLFRTT